MSSHDRIPRTDVPGIVSNASVPYNYPTGAQLLASLTTPSEAMFRTFTALGYTDAATVASIWPACVATDQENSTRNDCAGSSLGVLERGGD